MCKAIFLVILFVGMFASFGRKLRTCARVPRESRRNNWQGRKKRRIDARREIGELRERRDARGTLKEKRERASFLFFFFLGESCTSPRPQGVRKNFPGSFQEPRALEPNLRNKRRSPPVVGLSGDGLLLLLLFLLAHWDAIAGDLGDATRRETTPCRVRVTLRRGEVRLQSNSVASGKTRHWPGNTEQFLPVSEFPISGNGRPSARPNSISLVTNRALPRYSRSFFHRPSLVVSLYTGFNMPRQYTRYRPIFQINLFWRALHQHVISFISGNRRWNQQLFKRKRKRFRGVNFSSSSTLT